MSLSRIAEPAVPAPADSSPSQGEAAKWVGVPIIKVRRQQSAVRAIEASGGRCYWCGGKPLVPDWMRKRFALGDCISISHVDLPDESGDADMALLDDLPDLRQVMGCGCQVTDVGLEHLQGLSHLECVYLCNTQITGSGLEYLKYQSNLQLLDLSCTQINDAGLEHLGGLTNLRVLNLSDTHITNAGLPNLKMLTQLMELDCQNTQVTIDGVKDIQKVLPNCRIIVGRADRQ